MEPKLHNRGIVELINLAAHWDETVAVLNLFDVLLPRCLCCYFTQHCLGGVEYARKGCNEEKKVIKTDEGEVKEK